eukprot:scaffold63815_cov32-Tisochrysis_lutea.AAC.3
MQSVLEHILLLRLAQWLQARAAERAQARLIQPSRPRQRHYHVALWHERATDVCLKELESAAALVEAVQDEHGAPTPHRLPQHAQDGGLLLKLDLHVPVDPIPCGRKDIAPLRQPLVP